MNIHTEERSYWMGSDVAKYRRKRAVSLPDYAMPRPVKYGLAHPELCFGDYEPEHIVIVHLRQYDVTNWRRRCPYCGRHNRPGPDTCPGCGATQEEP